MITTHAIADGPGGVSAAIDGRGAGELNIGVSATTMAADTFAIDVSALAAGPWVPAQLGPPGLSGGSGSRFVPFSPASWFRVRRLSGTTAGVSALVADVPVATPLPLASGAIPAAPGASGWLDLSTAPTAIVQLSGSIDATDLVQIEADVDGASTAGRTIGTLVPGQVLPIGAGCLVRALRLAGTSGALLLEALGAVPAPLVPGAGAVFHQDDVTAGAHSGLVGDPFGVTPIVPGVIPHAAVPLGGAFAPILADTFVTLTAVPTNYGSGMTVSRSATGPSSFVLLEPGVDYVMPGAGRVLAIITPAAGGALAATDRVVVLYTAAT